MAKKTNRVKAAAIAAPQTRDEVVGYIAKIGAHQRERQRIEAAMNDQLAEIRETFEAEGLIHAQAITSMSQGVQSWCEANRVELTFNNKTKTVGFASGEVKWRNLPASVAVRGAEAVIEALKSLGLDRFVRKTEEVNKQAILAEPDAVKGVRGLKINKDGEQFVIEPFQTELERAAA